LFADRKFEQTCSFGPAGIFRLDYPENRKWAKASFDRFSFLEKTYGPRNTGVKLLSGHIQSDNKELLDSQERCMADIVYNFHWLDDREIHALFINPSKYCIHFTSYGSEGRTYVPWLRGELSKHSGVEFQQRSLSSIQELVDEADYDMVINCAGIDGGRLAGDDDSVYPVRGVAFEVSAPWHKHFNYRDVTIFTIPMNDSVIVGTVKQDHRADLEITEEDRREIWDNYLKLHPTFKDAKIISEWSGLRPTRPSVRLEKMEATSSSGKRSHVIHNYGHGSNGFTLAWGCALDVVQMISGIAGSLDAKLKSSL